MGRNELMNIDEIRDRIYTVRGVQVMIDTDLAVLYGVEVKRLNEQVKRNRGRFPERFMFQLSTKEYVLLSSQIVTLDENKINSKSQTVTSRTDSNLKSQFATSSWGGRRTNPYAFTEQGVAMLSAVLKSENAVKMSIQIIDAFIAMHRFITSYARVFNKALAPPWHRTSGISSRTRERSAIYTGGR